MANIPPIVKAVYKEYIAHFGEPDSSVRFGNEESKKGEEHLPDFIDVFIWEPNEDIDITTFMTIGMSAKPMKGADFRAELHFGVKGVITEEERSNICVFMANMAVYPFIQNTYFDWLHLMNNPGQIPCFDTTTALLFHPAFVEDGWDSIQMDEQLVKILNLVPITESERLLMKSEGFKALSKKFQADNIDLFTPR